MEHFDFYFASPFFTEEQIEREERLINHLRTHGFNVFSPRENILLDRDASHSDRLKCFRENIEAIKSSDAVFAVTDCKDVGTIWEAGYAYGIGKPVLYYAETLGEGKFNVMLAQSGMVCFQSQDELSFWALRQAKTGACREDYIGDVE